MQLASEQFRNTVELVAIVVSLLDRQDMLSFRLTCRTVHSVCQQFYFCEVRLDDRWTQDQLQGLAQHASAIRSLKIYQGIIQRYYKSVVDTLGNSTTPTSPFNSLANAPNTTSLQLSDSTRLVSLLSLDSLLNTLCCRHDPIAQLLHIVCFSPRLTVLDLSPLTTTTEIQLNFLTRVLSTIGTLQSLTLTLTLWTSTLTTEDVLTAVIHGCPPLLETISLSIDPRRSVWIAPTSESAKGEQRTALMDMVSKRLGPIKKRKEPLRRLTDWSLTVQSAHVDGSTFISLLKYLPELLSIDVPAVNNTISQHDPQINNIAHRIITHCPKLKHLRSRCVGPYARGALACRIAKLKPRNTLESFQFTNLDDTIRQSLCFDTRIAHHKQSIKRIVLDDWVKVRASTFKNILCQHSALEVFKTSASKLCQRKVEFGALSSDQWISTGLQELQLDLTLGFSSTRPILPELNSSSLFTKNLDRFYRQIGALPQLRILDLKLSTESFQTANYNDNSDSDNTDYMSKTFPGMMVLEDQAAGRLGWLQSLAKLTQLEELHGSFNVDSMLPGFKFGQREADWVVEHWPKLKFIELYTIPEGVLVEYSPAVQSLLDRRSGLKVVKRSRGRQPLHWR
ncbi:hypothetical protein BGW39_001156 [Mortierella sp. 14UC]|nr:hypothetical protein BGW39_001156 [Mortierella sp. 14UC]